MDIEDYIRQNNGDDEESGEDRMEAFRREYAEAGSRGLLDDRGIYWKDIDDDEWWCCPYCGSENVEDDVPVTIVSEDGNERTDMIYFTCYDCHRLDYRNVVWRMETQNAIPNEPAHTGPQIVDWSRKNRFVSKIRRMFRRRIA